MKAMYLTPSVEVMQVKAQAALLNISGPGGLTDSNQSGEGIDPQ
jgi:hypothetical protein